MAVTFVSCLVCFFELTQKLLSMDVELLHTAASGQHTLQCVLKEHHVRAGKTGLCAPSDVRCRPLLELFYNQRGHHSTALHSTRHTAQCSAEHAMIWELLSGPYDAWSTLRPQILNRWLLVLIHDYPLHSPLLPLSPSVLKRHRVSGESSATALHQTCILWLS